MNEGFVEADSPVLAGCSTHAAFFPSGGLFEVEYCGAASVAEHVSPFKWFGDG